MARSKELISARDTRFVEIDGRQSGETYYQLICHLGSSSLALLAKGAEGVRAVPIDAESGNDAMAHPEVYLKPGEVIYGGGYEELVVDYEEPMQEE